MEDRKAIRQAIVGLNRMIKLFDKYGWCKGASAFDRNGNEVEPESRRAASFCLFGAKDRVFSKWGTDSANDLLVDVLEDEIRYRSKYNYDFVSEYNDAPRRTKKQIINVLHGAIVRLEKELENKHAATK
jgi:hypothetical protein